MTTATCTWNELIESGWCLTAEDAAPGLKFVLIYDISPNIASDCSADVVFWKSCRFTSEVYPASAATLRTSKFRLGEQIVAIQEMRKFGIHSTDYEQHAEFKAHSAEQIGLLGLAKHLDSRMQYEQLKVCVRIETMCKLIGSEAYVSHFLT